MYHHKFVELVVFFTCSSNFALLTIKPEFVYQFVSESYNFTDNQSVVYCGDSQNSSISEQDKVQIVADEVSRWTQIGSVLQSTLNAISVLVLSSWSDVIGRRNALLFPVIGSLLCSLLLVINIHFRISLWLYVASAAIYGATGGWSALMNIGTAFLSDSIEKSQRSQRFTFLEVCASLGGGLSQIVTGVWAHYHGFLPPSIFIVFCSFLALLCTIFLKIGNGVEANKLEATDVSLRDVKPDFDQKKAERKTAISAIISQLREVTRIYTSNSIKCGVCKDDDCSHCDRKLKNRVWRLWFYLITYVVYMSAVDGSYTLMTMFLVSIPLCFSPALVGIQAGLSSVIVIFTPILVKLYRSVFHFSHQTILLSSVMGKITSTMLLLSTTKVAVFIATCLGAFSCLTTPFIRLQISNLVSPTEQGSALALVPSVEKLVNILSPVVLLTVYPATLHILPSFVWIVIAMYFLLAFLLMLVVWVADKTKKRYAKDVQQDQSL